MIFTILFSLRYSFVIDWLKAVAPGFNVDVAVVVTTTPSNILWWRFLLPLLWLQRPSDVKVKLLLSSVLPNQKYKQNKQQSCLL